MGLRWCRAELYPFIQAYRFRNDTNSYRPSVLLRLVTTVRTAIPHPKILRSVIERVAILVVYVSPVPFMCFTIPFLMATCHYTSSPTLNLLRAAVIRRVLLFVIPSHYLLTYLSILDIGHLAVDGDQSSFSVDSICTLVAVHYFAANKIND